MRSAWLFAISILAACGSGPTLVERIEARIDVGEYEVAAEQAKAFQADRDSRADPVEVVAVTRLHALALALGGDVEGGLEALTREFSGDRRFNEDLRLIGDLEKRGEYGRAVETVELALERWPSCRAQLEDWHVALVAEIQRLAAWNALRSPEQGEMERVYEQLFPFPCDHSGR